MILTASRPPRPYAIAVILAALSSLAFASPVVAATSVTTGWWTALPLATAPDAPDDGLVVQGGRDTEEPLAYAGVVYALEADEEPTFLTLTVAEGSASTPNSTLAVCVLTEGFSPVRGGDAESGPGYDCTAGTEAAPSGDGSQYEFDVSGLEGDGMLALAVVPTATSDRVVLDRPEVTSLSGPADSIGFDEPAPTPPDDTDFGSAPDASGGGSSDFGDSSDVGGSTDFGDSSTPDLDLGGAPETSAEADDDAAPSEPTDTTDSREISAPAPLPSPTAGDPADRSAFGALALIVLAAIAATLWFSAGRSGASIEREGASEPVPAGA